MSLPEWCTTHSEQLEVTSHGDQTRQYIDGLREIRDKVFPELSYTKYGDGWTWYFTAPGSFQASGTFRNVGAADSIREARMRALQYLSDEWPDEYPHAIMVKTAMEIADEEFR